MHFSAPWVPASSSSTAVILLRMGWRVFFCQPPLSSPPTPTLISYAEIVCKEIRVRGEEFLSGRIGDQHLQAGSLLQALPLLGAAASGQEVK